MEFTIGLDAEFALETRDGRFVNAGSHLPGTTARFGTDSCSAIGEVRPHYGHDPVELVANIKSAMQRGLTARPRVASFNIVAGARRNNYALGAHIHIGHESFLTNAPGLTYEQRQSHSRRAQNRMAVAGALMDAFVLPFATIFGDPRNESHRRRENGYGRPSDVRPQAWGFEYRSCSSFIASPATSLGVLTAAYVVMNEYLEGRVAGMDSEWAEFKLNADAFYRNAVQESKRNLREKMTWLMNRQTVKDNKVYREILAVLFQMIDKGTYEQVCDMKKAWKLRYTEPEEVRPMGVSEALTLTEVR